MKIAMTSYKKNKSRLYLREFITDKDMIMPRRDTNLIGSASSLSDEVYKSLCTDIANGVFKPGDRLGIEKIARMKGVSPMPVREALQRIERDGLAAKSLNCGFRVKMLSPQEGQEIWAIRIALETLAVKWLMRRKKIPQKLISELRKSCEQYRKCKHIRELYVLDLKFHNIIINNCGATQLQDILSKRMILLNSFCLSNSLAEIPTLDSIEKCYQEHTHLIDCIESGDAKGAEKAMRDHLEQANDYLVKNLTGK